MLLISLLGLVHFRVARPIFVFRRARGFDDRHIYDRTFFERKSFDRPNGVDGAEDSLGEIAFFQQATELEHGRRIRRCRIRLPSMQRSAVNPAHLTGFAQTSAADLRSTDILDQSLAIIRFASPNSVCSCAVFLANPR